MVMTKTDGSFKNMTVVIGFFISLGSIAVSTGILLNKVEVNSRDIADLKLNGCGPAIVVNSHLEVISVRLESIQKNLDRIEAQSKEMNTKQDKQLEKIIDSLLP